MIGQVRRISEDMGDNQRRRTSSTKPISLQLTCVVSDTPPCDDAVLMAPWVEDGTQIQLTKETQDN